MTEVIKPAEENTAPETVETDDEFVKEDSLRILEKGMVDQIIYKRMFFSFLGKMCSVDILPGDLY